MMEFLLVFARRKFLLFDEVPIEMMISNDLRLFSFFFCRQEQLPVWWFFALFVIIEAHLKCIAMTQTTTGDV